MSTESKTARERQFITPRILAEQLGVSPGWVLAMIRSGELTAINVGRGQRPKWRISIEERDRLLDSLSNQNQSA